MQTTHTSAFRRTPHGFRLLAPGLAALTLLGLAAAPAAHAQGYALTTLVSFDGTNGQNPYAGLTLSADGSTLYGTTNYGGPDGSGTLFSEPVTGGAPTTLVSFDTSNGAFPAGRLTLSGSTLYGTTISGGISSGTVFSVPVTGGAPTTLANFTGSNGADPFAGLTLGADGTLYGTTPGGGTSNAGNVFSIPKGGGTLTTLANFDGTNGKSPFGSLVLSGSTLYGTTSTGGDNGFGTVFSVPITGGAPTTLATFNGSNGNGSYADLTLGPDGNLYGTTFQGGDNNDGTVFSVPVTGGAVTTLVSFDGTNGQGPQGGLTLGADGLLYGTTSFGGVGAGTVFSIPVGGGALTTLVTFDGINGKEDEPVGDLTIGADGTLYGTTLYGGGNENGGIVSGTVFSLTPLAAVPEASSLTSFGLLLTTGLGAMALRARRRSAAS